MSDPMKRGGRPRAAALVRAVIRRYFIHDVGRQGAALAYYLLFMLFPFLIFVSSLLGLLHLDVSQILRTLSPLLPSQVLEGLRLYLEHVSLASSPALLWSALVLAVWFPTRAADCLMGSVRRAYYLGSPRNRLRHGGKVLLYTVFLLSAIALTLLLMSVGQRALGWLGGIFRLPAGLVPLWNVGRFVVLAVVMFAAVGFLYALAQDARRPGGEVVPGALLAVAAWMVLSAAYAWYVEHVADYDRLYGTLGTVVVLLIWLYLTAVILIMGAELNGVIAAGREKYRPL